MNMKVGWLKGLSLVSVVACEKTALIGAFLSNAAEKILRLSESYASFRQIGPDSRVLVSHGFVVAEQSNIYVVAFGST